MAVLELRNDSLTVIINTLGAEIMSVKNRAGDEYIWQGDPAVWKYRAPICFPICGDLNDGRYTYDGKEYRLPRHGFARDMEFEMQETSASPDSACDAAGNTAANEKDGIVNSVLFALESSEKTRSIYPFDFILTVAYELTGNTLTVTYKVENRTPGDMYFSIGSHEGYACPEGIEGYSVFLDEIVPLKHGYFEGEGDTLVYEAPEFTQATLKYFGAPARVAVDFGNVSSFSIWTKPRAEFICLEPWHGIPEDAGSDPDISKKPGFIKLEKDEVFEASHSITFNYEL